MLRRLSFSAALAALAVPVLLSGPASAADPGGTPSDDPGAQAQLRKSEQKPPSRRVEVSRRAKRAKEAKQAETDTPLSVTIDQLTPSTIPEKGLVRVTGTVTNNDTATWRLINTYAFVSDDPL